MYIAKYLIISSINLKNNQILSYIFSESKINNQKYEK